MSACTYIVSSWKLLLMFVSFVTPCPGEAPLNNCCNQTATCVCTKW